MQKIVIFLLRIYKLFISPYLGSRCRFYPSCSDYAHSAVIQHGVAKGSWFALKRLCRCHPFCKGGVDPVPPSHSSSVSPFSKT